MGTTPQLSDEALARAWARLRRPFWILGALALVGVAAVVLTLTLPVSPPSVSSGMRVERGTVTGVTEAKGRPGYTVVLDTGSSELGPAPSDEPLAVGDRAWVTMEGSKALVVAPRAHPALYPTFLVSVIVGLLSILALGVHGLRYAQARGQAKRGWTLVVLRSHGQGRPKRVLSPRLLLNAVTMLFGVRILAARAGGRWFTYDQPRSGTIRTSSRRDDERLAAARWVAIPNGTAPPVVVLPEGSDRFIRL